MAQQKIDYSWNESPSNLDEAYENLKAESEQAKEADGPGLSTRHNLQIPRRLFHMANGFVIASLYLVTFTHSQMIHILGTLACGLYLVEQIRINYPETAAKLLPFTKLIMRAEEQLKESAMVPYMMAVLLTIITFPKHIALVGIYTLAFADPLSALVGIRFGKHKLSPTRSVEGGAAFFITTFVISGLILAAYNGGFSLSVLGVATLLGICCTLFDLVPLKIDDNLTIPLFTSAALWLICTLFGIYL